LFSIPPLSVRVGTLLAQPSGWVGDALPTNGFT
jgi:hypothetical protein